VPIAPSADVVVIELPDEHGAEANGVIDSCQMVLGDGHCRFPNQGGAAARWYAVLRWQDAERLRLRMELHRSGRDGPLLSTREMTFSEADSQEQRYRAAGLLIVSHVVAAGRAQADSNSSDAPEKEKDQQPAPTPAPAPAETTSWGVDVAALAGRALRPTELRWGGWVRGWFAVHSWHLRPVLSVGWATASGAADVTWLEGSLGTALVAELPAWPVSFELRLEGLAQRVELFASGETGTDRQLLTRFGARVGVDGFLNVNDHFALFVGGQISAVRPSYTLEVEGGPEGGERAPVWAAVGGLRVSR